MDAGGDRGDARQARHGDWRAAVRSRPVAESARAVGAPAFDGPVGEEGTGVAVASSHLDDGAAEGAASPSLVPPKLPSVAFIAIQDPPSTRNSPEATPLASAPVDVTVTVRAGDRGFGTRTGWSRLAGSCRLPR